MKLLGYVRVSTDKQADSGLGLEAQTIQIESYCKTYSEFELVEIISDEGASAKNLKRDGLQRILNMLVNGGAEGVIIAKLDRLTRSVKDLGVLIDDYFTKFTLISVNDKIDTTSPSGRLMLNILASVSQWEREEIGLRTKKALRVKLSKGFYLGQARFGYSVENGKLIPNPEEQEIIKVITSLRARGFTLEKIAQILNEKGNLTRRGSKWTYRTVCAIG